MPKFYPGRLIWIFLYLYLQYDLLVSVLSVCSFWELYLYSPNVIVYLGPSCCHGGFFVILAFMRPRIEQFASYWDEHPRAKRYFVRGKFKRYYRKKFYRVLFKFLDME